MVDLNNISPRTIFILNIIVIVLLITATVFLFTEINYIKNHGGDCLKDPLSFAEQHALEKQKVYVNCYCVPKLNLTGGLK